MSNTLAGQLKQFYDTILAQRGVTITYRQRGIVVENVPAIPTRPKLLNENSGNNRTKVVDREYIVEFGLLIWDGKQVKPKPGDHIIDGETVYEVVEDTAKQCYRPTDSQELYARIFVQKTSKTVAALPPPSNFTGMGDEAVRQMMDKVFDVTLPPRQDFVPMGDDGVKEMIDVVFDAVLPPAGGFVGMGKDAVKQMMDGVFGE
jgi:hypothetical protein